MKFFSKYKKQILSVFLCVALFSCFLCFSFSSSAAPVSVVSTLDLSSVYFDTRPGLDLDSFYSFSKVSENQFIFDKQLSYPDPTPIFIELGLAFYDDYSVPEYSGRPLSISFNIDFDVLNTGYLEVVPDDVSIYNSAIFTSCYCVLYLSDGSIVTFTPSSFVLMDDLNGLVVDPSSEQYWRSIAGSPANFSLNVLFDVSSILGRIVTNTFIVFPYPSGSIYYQSGIPDYLSIDNCIASYSFLYSPFNDVVQDDLSDIKGSLSGVNNKLDSLNSTMNTIDQDVNRVDQKLEQTNETLGNIDQGIQDILKPSTPAVDFKNQWNDYFANNPMPDISNLPFYDMSNMMTLLADSSSIIRNIFSPFFLRDYSVTVPLTQGFSHLSLDPVATYVSLSFALSLSLLIIGILKGSRG